MELGFADTSPSVILEDNQACVAMIKNSSVSARNRHFCVKMAWLREQVANGHVTFRFVASKSNLADIFTKLLPEEAFCRLRDALMNGTQTRGECYIILLVTPSTSVPSTVS